MIKSRFLVFFITLALLLQLALSVFGVAWMSLPLLLGKAKTSLKIGGGGALSSVSVVAKTTDGSSTTAGVGLFNTRSFL